ncbi:hypothetical protein K491DRAFT_193809 [Lophiostoma macrostomum CBS 122681]|uniref:Uncharacterized protein n=1 Tax=Lophiostoma macrostomum CBS 122681 TaxID=1314788 RepID=A0A6A6THB9_9PLEO|nr:hypothetical protein K491DRAFT_193809 [Lophiostoma macrostomum CBS 122681]
MPPTPTTSKPPPSSNSGPIWAVLFYRPPVIPASSAPYVVPGAEPPRTIICSYDKMHIAAAACELSIRYPHVYIQEFCPGKYFHLKHRPTGEDVGRFVVQKMEQVELHKPFAPIDFGGDEGEAKEVQRSGRWRLSTIEEVEEEEEKEKKEKEEKEKAEGKDKGEGVDKKDKKDDDPGEGFGAPGSAVGCGATAGSGNVI